MDKKFIDKEASLIKLRDVFLFESTITRHVHITENWFPQSMFQQTKMSMGVELAEFPGIEDGYEILWVKIEFGVRFINQDNEGSKPSPLADIEAVFHAEYKMKEIEDIPVNKLIEFFQQEIVRDVWPYWREHAIRIAAETKLPKPDIEFNCNVPVKIIIEP